MIYEELKNAFPKATFGCAKKCRTIQYGTAEPCLANAYHEIAEKDEYCGHPKSAVGIAREKSLEAIKICKALSPPTLPKLVALPLRLKKHLPYKFNISDNRMIIKAYGSKKAHNPNKESRIKTEGGVQSGSLISDSNIAEREATIILVFPEV